MRFLFPALLLLVCSAAWVHACDTDVPPTKGPCPGADSEPPARTRTNFTGARVDQPSVVDNTKAKTEQAYDPYLKEKKVTGPAGVQTVPNLDRSADTVQPTAVSRLPVGECECSQTVTDWRPDEQYRMTPAGMAWRSDVDPQYAAATPAAEKARRQALILANTGSREQALVAAREGLAKNPDDKQLKNLVDGLTHTETAEKTVKQRAKDLIASLRGETGDAPPGTALASPLPFPAALAPAAAGALGPMAMGTAGHAATAAIFGAKESGVRLNNPLLSGAHSKFKVGDYPGAEAMLTRRLQENPSDQPALLLRAITFRQMQKFQPSAEDARGAKTLMPWDPVARRVLVDDLVSLGRPDEALAEADAGLREIPNSAHLLAARAGVWESLGKREEELADLKQAAALDAQFGTLYQNALNAAAAPALARKPHSNVVWLGAIGTALLFFSYVLYRRRGDSSIRYAMRQEDHEVLARGARPDAMPQGFKVVKTLGKGGMGVVYEAVDVGLQRTVAIKKLRSEIADNPRERARFLKEARTVAGLKHPNIVAIHSIHEDAEGLFLVFEKVAGGTLHERLGTGPLSAAETVSVLRQVAQALDHAHANGVIHQDLKPANVMLESGSAKVMDFGIARRVAETLSTMSKIEVAGTPAYMAPEQEMGGAVGPTTDVFALGACAYEVLAGRTPFPSGGMMMKAEKMFRPVTEQRPELPRAVDEVIGRALEPEANKRWPSASAFVEALARSLAVPA